MKESQAAVEGENSFLTAEIACLEVAYYEDVCMAFTTTKSDLDRHQNDKLDKFLAEYSNKRGSRRYGPIKE